MPPDQSDALDLPDGTFKAPAKWEQNLLTHSPGYVTLTAESVEFHPGSMSIIGKQIVIPLREILKVRRGDNFLWRGVVKVDLKAKIDGCQCYVFFLGGKRNQFLSLCEAQGVAVS